MPTTSLHYVTDIKTGLTYGLMLDGDGNCLKVQALDNTLQTQTGTLVQKFTHANRKGAKADSLPYGETIYAVELTGDDQKPGGLFTLTFPKERGQLPKVERRSLPADFTRAGFAPPQKEKPAISFQEAMKPIDDMIGMDGPKRQLLRHIAQEELNAAKAEMGVATSGISRHMVLSGPPGTGKTTFAREVASIYHAAGMLAEPKFVEMSQDIVSKFVGDTALKVKETFEKAKGGVLFIDEFYALMSGSGENVSTHHKQAVDMIVALLDNVRDDTIVIVAGYPHEMEEALKKNPGLKSRFPTVIDFQSYTLPQLGEILDHMVASRGYSMAPGVREEAMARLAAEKAADKGDFANARAVRNMAEAMEQELSLRLFNSGALAQRHALPPEERRNLLTITLEDIRNVPVVHKAAPPRNPIGFRREDGTSLAA